VHPENGHKNDLRDETLPYKEQTERAGAVQPGEEKAPRRPFSIYKEVIRKKGTKSLAWSVLIGQEEMVFKLRGVI